MPRIPPLAYETADPEVRAEFDQIIAAHGRLTNMKQTLAHSPVALRALMEWYPLRDEVEPFLGQRLTTLFVHAISTATDCLICSTFFRRILIDSGEDPDNLVLDEKEQAIVEYGRQLVRDPNQVSDDLFARLRRHFTPAQIVALTAFGGIMIATNVFNNALRVDLDDYLQPYRKRSSSSQNVAQEKISS
jgi:alkylhydroperoxidase family enzyme